MPKRTFWLAAGAVLGAGTSLWAERRVRRTVEQAAARLQPDALVVEVGRSARQVAGSTGNRLRGAMSSGRHEMQRREEELWAELAAQGVDTPPSVAGPTSRPPLSAPAREEPVTPNPADRRPSSRSVLGRPRRKSASHLGN